MKTDAQDYTKILADLKNRLKGLELSRNKLLTAISAIQDIVNEVGNGIADMNQKIAPTQYRGKTILQGAKDLWNIGGRKSMKTRAICVGLQQGGISSKSDNFWNIVHSTLSRSDEWESKNGYWSYIGDDSDTRLDLRETA